MKKWFTVHAPPYFGGHDIASIPADDDAKALSRVIETTLYNLTKQDISQMNIKMYFQLTDIKGERGETVFKGHEYSREYLRSLVRRGGSRVDGIFDVPIKDGYKVRAYASAFSRRRLNPSQENAIRRIMRETLLEKGKALTFDQLSQELVLGKVASDIYNKVVKIAPLRHVGVRKSKLLAMPKTP
jgi:small subunit ribosomal protein S3Ae